MMNLEGFGGNHEAVKTGDMEKSSAKFLTRRSARTQLPGKGG